MAVGLLLPALPVMLVEAVFVAASLGRPVLFYQERAGRNGTTFKLVKFRSMRPQAVGQPALTDEQRVTRTGLLIRRLRLDELPQLWLILLGHMAFVGPRPLYPDGASPENRALFARRGEVRPGLTGWAQVNGNTLLTEREKLALDVDYVRRYSPSFDLKILAMTILTVVCGERRNEAAIKEALDYADRTDWGG